MSVRTIARRRPRSACEPPLTSEHSWEPTAADMAGMRRSAVSGATCTCECHVDASINFCEEVSQSMSGDRGVERRHAGGRAGGTWREGAGGCAGKDVG